MFTLIAFIARVSLLLLVTATGAHDIVNAVAVVA